MEVTHESEEEDVYCGMGGCTETQGLFYSISFTSASFWCMRIYASLEKMGLSLICLGSAPGVKGPGGISEKTGLLVFLQ